MSRADLIVTTPGVRGGKPRFVDTRLTVQDVLEYLAHVEILEDFPQLAEEHLCARLSSPRTATDFTAARAAFRG